MTLRRLYSVLQAMGQEEAIRQNQTMPQPEDSADAFLVQGTILAVQGNGEYEVLVGQFGDRQTASAVTDEPLESGALVWLSRISTGEWVVHGSVK